MISLRAGETVTISESSVAFDAFLTLFDPDGIAVAADDDSGGGTDARIVFTAGVAGTYFIDAGTFDPLAAGSYTLSVQ